MERAPRHDRPPVDLTIWPALQVGALTGTSGVIVGGVSGLIRSSSPALFAAASGIQWFALGSAFWASRGAVLHAWGIDAATPKERTCQSVYNFADAKHSDMQQSGFEGPRKRSTWENLLNSKWSPVKPLSDKEYEQMLEEKLLRLNAEIALIDEDIAILKEKAKRPTSMNRLDRDGESIPKR
ncbi:hypothetical protein FGG08_005012 [Glutinoglossum americanum]|uniref:Transmembrane protein n=1 Tax=Glutinoglossum americanum TaxID=1670608 RepID=A0A9P8L271_9PEZI|nr:hypothetical protein FGG08_005012 [Glutinoglossum americanum]